MTSRASLSNTLVRGAALALVSAALLAGCEKKKPPPPPPPPPPPAPTVPDKVDVQALLQEHHSDARVQFPDDNAPTDRTLAEGVILLANALAKGDSGAMRDMLDQSGKAVLDELVSNGGWEESTKKIEAVRIVRLLQEGYERPPATLATAIQDPDGAYVLVWKAQPTEDSYVFSPQLAADGVKARASEWDDQEVTGSLGLELGFGGEAADGAAPEGAPEEETPEKQRDPMRKSTPAGPITIPNPGGGGGGGGGGG